MKAYIHYRWQDYTDEFGNFFSVAVAQKKLSNGQTAEMLFMPDHNDNHEKCFWWIAFQIYSKRKHKDRNFDENRITGKCGMEGLLFAAQAIDDFPNFLISLPDEQSYQHSLLVHGSDPVRRKIYAHFLPRKGFEKTMYMGSEVLIKRLDNLTWPQDCCIIEE